MPSMLWTRHGHVVISHDTAFCVVSCRLDLAFKADSTRNVAEWEPLR